MGDEAFGLGFAAGQEGGDGWRYRGHDARDGVVGEGAGATGHGAHQPQRVGSVANGRLGFRHAADAANLDAG